MASGITTLKFCLKTSKKIANFLIIFGMMWFLFSKPCRTP